MISDTCCHCGKYWNMCSCPLTSNGMIKYSDAINLDIPTIPYKLLDKQAKDPERNNLDDAGIDLFALEDCVIPSLFVCLWNFIKEQLRLLYTFRRHESNLNLDSIITTKIKTGIAFEIPYGNVGLICDRSSMGSRLIVKTGGVIDAGYRGDITCMLINLSFTDYEVKKGDKIAQMIIVPCNLSPLNKVKNLSESVRGEKGFGSSGK